MDSVTQSTVPRIDARLFSGKLILLNVFTALGYANGHAYIGFFVGILYMLIFT